MWNNNKTICRKVKEKADAMILHSPVNRRYVTGFLSSAGLVAVIGEKIYFFTDFRYFESAQIMQQKGKVDSDIEICLMDKDFMSNLKELLKDCKTILFEEGFISYATYNHYKNSLDFAQLCEGATLLLSSVRSVKTEDELEKIKIAQSITDKTYEFALKYISDNVGRHNFTERELQLEMDYFMVKNGADEPAFDTIAISGNKTTLPHGAPENIAISKGFLTMDFGAKYMGYCSDMTRTVCIGKPSEEMLKVYNTVIDARCACFEIIKADVEGKAVDKAARDLIDKAGFEGCFGHSLGHSLGLEIHESPNFAPNSSAIIPENAVLSVEPGIYLAGKFGVRVEDIVCLKNDGFINFTKSSDELVVI